MLSNEERTPPMNDMQVFTSKQAAEMLGIAYITLKRYIDNPDIPLEGSLLNSRTRVFTRQELDEFKKYLDEHPPQRGRPADPEAPHHGARQRRSQAQQIDGTPQQHQWVADRLKAMVGRDKRALKAISEFEGLAWYPQAFAAICSQFDISGEDIRFDGEGELFEEVIGCLAAYREVIS
jgi:hypothetical protein